MYKIFPSTEVILKHHFSAEVLDGVRAPKSGSHVTHLLDCHEISPTVTGLRGATGKGNLQLQ